MDALNSDEESINPITPCPHTLFLATDEGYEFKRDDVIVNDEDEDEGFDTMTDSVNKLNAIKICQYEGAPSGIGSYIGFSENWKSFLMSYIYAGIFLYFFIEGLI